MPEISVRNKISSIARTVIFENLIAPAIRYYGPHKARKAFAVFAFPLRSLRQNIPHPFFQRKVRKEFRRKGRKAFAFLCVPSAFFASKHPAPLFSTQSSQRIQTQRTQSLCSDVKSPDAKVPRQYANCVFFAEDQLKYDIMTAARETGDMSGSA